MKSNSSTPKVILLYPYFGKLPWYTNYFIHTCGYNSNIDFLIMSENKLMMNLPKNVWYEKLTLKQFQRISSNRLQCRTNVNPAPFKFCDLRPAFGIIFSDYLKGYNFWGHGDIDVIFGNIRKFITNDILSSHDLIFARHDYISSWFSLYRNCDEINNLFRLTKDYLKVFTSPGYFNFDETNFAFTEFSAGLSPLSIKSEVESMTHLVKTLQNSKKVKAYFDLHAIEGLTGGISWQAGKLIFKKKFEIMLYHLLHLKKVFKPKPAHFTILPERFNISSTRIYF